MTREEAIDRLMWLKGVPHINDDKWIEAVDMAIEALQAEREQPDMCIAYGSGVCGYPIEACCECPKHEYYRELEKKACCNDNFCSNCDAPMVKEKG